MSGTRLKTESETGERTFARFAYALPISLLILRKKPSVLQSKVNDENVELEGVCVTKESVIVLMVRVK